MKKSKLEKFQGLEIKTKQAKTVKGGAAGVTITIDDSTAIASRKLMVR